MKKNLLKHFLLLLFTATLFQSCKKDEENHPEVQTFAITALSPSKALFKGNIVSKGSFTISDHGFIYGYNPTLNESTGTRISLGQNAQEGIISKEVHSLYAGNYNRTLFVRAYLTNTEGTVYGEVTSVQMPSVNASSIVPSSAKAGERVSINGQFYTTDKNEVEVRFGNVVAKVIEVTPTKITVEVPTGINTSYSSSNQVSVSVNIGGQNLNISYNFRLLPNLKDYAPKSNYISSIITISGDNLPSSYYYSNIKVLFGNAEATISSINNNSINVTVPASVTSEKNIISVIIDGVTTVLPGEFTVLPYTVSSISPTSGLPGSSFSIFGTYFPSNSYSNNNLRVTIGDIPASISYVSSGQLTATIPNDLPEGDYKVVVSSGPYRIEAPQKLKVKALSISGFSPSSGGAGKEVTIQGVFNPGQQYQVFFGSVSTYSTSTSATSLRVYVPGGLDAGNVKLSVRYGNQTVVSSDEFTIVAPSITSFTPTSGVAGTIVTISGVGFTPNTYYNNNVVKFGTIASPNILSATESTLRVTVPSNLNPGAMKISVTNSFGQTMVSSANFTVTN